MFDSKFHGHRSTKLQLIYEIDNGHMDDRPNNFPGYTDEQPNNFPRYTDEQPYNFHRYTDEWPKSPIACYHDSRCVVVVWLWRWSGRWGVGRGLPLPRLSL